MRFFEFLKRIIYTLNQKNAPLNQTMLTTWELLLEMELYKWTQKKLKLLETGQHHRRNKMYNHFLVSVISFDSSFVGLVKLLDLLVV